MRRGAPMRRTPMSPRTTRLESRSGLKRGGTLDRRTRIKPRSDKTAAVYEVRRPLVAKILAERPWCEIRWDSRCQRRSSQVHEPEMRSRSQVDICDETKCVATCGYCHGMAHTHPAEATRRGWMVPSGPPRKAVRQP